MGDGHTPSPSAKAPVMDGTTAATARARSVSPLRVAGKSQASPLASSPGSSRTPGGGRHRRALSAALCVGFVFATAWGVYALVTGSCSKSVAVWWYGWITCVSTGLGGVPFLFLDSMADRWLGFANSLAAGMMASASVGLFMEGSVQHDLDPSRYPALYRVVAGLVAGVLFIRISKAWLDQHEHLKFAGLSGVSARKMLLIVAVMTLHSFSEGVGIGVAFGGRSGDTFGLFITATLALHNIPEGLAICLALIPQHIHVLEASAWAILTSLPQPLMAVPAYLFTQQMLTVLPVGLGFAAGAMAYVAAFDLLVEAAEKVGYPFASVVSCAAGVAFYVVQVVVKSEI